ncbi:MAG: sigma-54-dependent Fis family transcriptional regulator [Desulfobacteraceae bacterium]|nr:sigma-54-dependent Fis family transcriptional regulator [Desulfobacteraceae bacterium]MBC2755028.1 sigma-54-dependent Fis family transcriptional regulator [Desulfobacteraceae bacterium]
MANVLIIDDEEAICNLLARPIQREQHHVEYALTLKQGKTCAADGNFDVIFLDVNLPDGNGLDALSAFKKAPSSPDVIIITGAGNPDGAELAIRSGAWTYIQKPPLMSDIILQLNRVLQYREEKEQRQRPSILKREGIVGSSPQLESCLSQVAQVAGSDVNVLITGETGTGKELFARTIHNNSFRAGKNFVVVDCASLPEMLVNSMLFGHKKGSFTGAQMDRSGLIKEADGGTLFLDEVGELSLAHQKEFLRVLQENRFRPIGSNREIESDFRLIAATNRDLNEMVNSGQFRKDLLYRIQSFNIHLPPLKSRPQDIKEMSQHWINILCEKQGIETKGFSPDFFETLMTYDWPGNIRELIHTMERVFTVARFDPTLFSRHLPTKIRVHQARSSVNRDEVKNENIPSEKHVNTFRKLQEVRESAVAEAEKQYLKDLMEHTKRNMKEAIRISGLSQSRLYSLLKKYQIPRS